MKIRVRAINVYAVTEGVEVTFGNRTPDIGIKVIVHHTLDSI